MRGKCVCEALTFRWRASIHTRHSKTDLVNTTGSGKIFQQRTPLAHLYGSTARQDGSDAREASFPASTNLLLLSINATRRPATATAQTSIWPSPQYKKALKREQTLTIVTDNVVATKPIAKKDESVPVLAALPTANFAKNIPCQRRRRTFSRAATRFCKKYLRIFFTNASLEFKMC